MTLTLAVMALNTPILADNPPTRISDEGGAKSVFFNLDCVGPNVTCSTSGINATITTTDANTNAATECTGLEYLAGNGSCTLIPSPTEDTNANTICSGTTTYLDGEGNCDNLIGGMVDTGVVYLSGSYPASESDFTYNATTNHLELGTGTADFNTIGLAGAAANSGAAINLSNVTSSSLLGPLLSTLTYTGTSTVAAALQSEINHTGTATNANVWGALVAARAGTSQTGLSIYSGLDAAAEMYSTSTVQNGEIAVFYGVNARAAGNVGGTHDVGALIAAVGLNIANFATPTNATFVRHGILIGEPLSAAAGVKYGYDASLLANATTVTYYNSGSGEWRLEVAGTETFASTSSAIGWFGVTPQARPSAYTITNGLTDRAYNVDSTSVAELADVVYTLIQDLKGYGLLQ